MVRIVRSREAIEREYWVANVDDPNPFQRGVLAALSWLIGKNDEPPSSVTG